MPVLRAFPARSVVALLWLVGCPRPQIVARPPPDPGALYIEAKKAHGIPETLTCDAKAFVEAPENSGRYALHLSVKRPASLRIEALTAIGDPAAVLVADGGRFALLDLRSNVFYRGPSTPENLSRLIPQPLRDEELVALVLGAMPLLPAARPVEAHRAGEGSVLTLESGEVRQEISVGADLRIDHVRRFRRGQLWWEVALD